MLALWIALGPTGQTGAAALAPVGMEKAYGAEKLPPRQKTAGVLALRSNTMKLEFATCWTVR